MLRTVAGAVLIGVGLGLGDRCLALAGIGLVPLAAGVFDVCVLVVPAGRPFVGRVLRPEAAGPR